MKYFYLSFPPKYANPKCDKCCPSIVKVIEEILENFKIEPYEYGSSPYDYYDRGYKVKDIRKYRKIRSFIKHSHPKVKVVWTGNNDSWKD